jgi:3-dehydroquinate synthase II
VSRERAVLDLRPARTETVAGLLRAARDRGYSRFLLADPSVAPEGTEVFTEQTDQLCRCQGNGPDRIPIVTVHEPRDLEEAVRRGRESGAVAVRWGPDRVIPLENLIALAREQFSTWVLLDDRAEAPTMLGALERGADRVVIPFERIDDLDAIDAAVAGPVVPPLRWELHPVTRVARAGPGDRVLVDTTSLLRPEEGMLVGSAAAFLMHVASEAVGSRFTRPRPFRVNAGGPHSYLLLADGSTRYLSEVEPGDAVAVAVPNHAPRAVRVGRVKVERRPMVLVELERERRRFTVFLQEAETVRVSGERERLAVTSLHPGDRIFGVSLPPARHLGGLVRETIEER